MKTTDFAMLFAALFAFAIQASGAESVLKGDLDQQKLTMAKTWKVEGNTATGVQIPNKWPSILLTLDLEGNTFYRISYEYQLQEGTEKDSFNVKIGGKMILRQIANSEWTKTAGYFYNEKAGKQKMQIYLEGPTAFRASFRDLKIEKLAPEEVKTITADFNADAGPNPSFFYKHSPKSDAWKLEIVPAEDFVDEGKALKVTNTAEDKGCNVRSHQLPLELNKNYRLTFWAKAKKPVAVTVCVDGYLRGAKKHFYRAAKYQLAEEWKQYMLDFKSPTEGEHPEMAKHTVCLVLSLPKNSSAEFKNFVMEQK